jgi:hypothetical protein
MNSIIQLLVRRAGSLLLLVLLCAFVGCAALVDSPPTPVGPLTDVRSIYVPVSIVGDTLVYAISDSDYEHHVAFRDSITIITQGALTSKNFVPGGVIPAGLSGFHATIPHPRDHGMILPADTLFATSQDKAYNIWYDEDHMNHSVETYRWLDLQQPIKDSASWQFTTTESSNGGNQLSVLATVTLYDRTIAFDGISYSHVTEITYTDTKRGANDQPLQIKWYAKDIGLVRAIIFSNGDDHGHGKHITDRRLISHN